MRALAHDLEATLTGPGAPAPSSEIAAGTTIGEFVVEAAIGEGAFGKVYRGVHAVIGKRVAIKVLHSMAGARGDLGRFLGEARALARIRHPLVVGIYAFGILADGRAYYVMDFLEGESLEAMLRRRGRLALDEALDLLGKIAKAVDAAHHHGVVHRDLKPDNVFLVAGEGGVRSPRLLDFGIAKLPLSDVATRTRSGVTLGTPAYMSPEQCRGGEVDERTDVYAFGVMAHRMLTGRLPFEHAGMLDMMLAHTTAAPPRMSTLRSDLPPALDAVVLAALAKNPDHRPPRASVVVDLLRASARGSQQVASRRARAVVVMASLLVCLLAITAWFARSGTGEVAPGPSPSAAVAPLAAASITVLGAVASPSPSPSPSPNTSVLASPSPARPVRKKTELPPALESPF